MANLGWMLRARVRTYRVQTRYTMNRRSEGRIAGP